MSIFRNPEPEPQNDQQWQENTTFYLEQEQANGDNKYMNIYLCLFIVGLRNQGSWVIYPLRTSWKLEKTFKKVRFMEDMIVQVGYCTHTKIIMPLNSLRRSCSDSFIKITPAEVFYTSNTLLFLWQDVGIYLAIATSLLNHYSLKLLKSHLHLFKCSWTFRSQEGPRNERGLVQTMHVNQNKSKRLKIAGWSSKDSETTQRNKRVGWKDNQQEKKTLLPKQFD